MTEILQNLEVRAKQMQSEDSEQTNWFVIIGASGSGKSTLIDELSRRGFHAKPEAALVVLEEHERDLGQTFEQTRSNKDLFGLLVLQRHRYRGVFLLEPLPKPFESRKGRTETAERVVRDHHALARCYQNLGYDLPFVSVPAFSVEQRADFVLSEVSRMTKQGIVP